MAAIKRFLNKHGLPSAYRHTAEQFFNPLVNTLIKQKQKTSPKTFFIGINGCQGSGKTTLADYLVLQFQRAGHTACALSIDDFYYTQAKRQALSQQIHPLLKTRGVPGTHDVPLALATLQALSKVGQVSLPRYNKIADDRYPQTAWQRVTAPLSLVILEGWCVAIPPQHDTDLLTPINQLERQHDADGHWRHFINQCLKSDYAQLWQRLDYLIMLKAPSFDCVYRWRLEQENKLRQTIKPTENTENQLMSAKQLEVFIAHYERLTRHALNTLPAQCDRVFKMDTERTIT